MFLRDKPFKNLTITLFSMDQSNVFENLKKPEFYRSNLDSININEVMKLCLQ